GPIRANHFPVHSRESGDPLLRCSDFSIALWIPALAGMNAGWGAFRWSCADRIYRLFTAQHPRDVARAFCLQFIEGFDRIESSVRRDDDIVAAKEGRILCKRFHCHHIEPGATDLS